MTSIDRPTLEELLDKVRLVRFHHYKDGCLFYNVDSYYFSFPIPVDDIGNGVLKSVMKATELERWIREHFEELSKND